MYRGRRTSKEGTPNTMTGPEILSFLRAQKWAVQASVASDVHPQAAVVGVAVTDHLELVFDTMGDTRKTVNLRANPKIAIVIGWDDEQTVQIEGVADEPKGDELTRVKSAYFEKFPDGREREGWDGITYFRVHPTWIRYSDFRGTHPTGRTWAGPSLAHLIAEARASG
jgi:general stress protein 26